MSTECPSRQRRESDENFDELVKALRFKRDQFLVTKEGKSANPVEAQIDLGEVTSSWKNKTTTCVIRDFPGLHLCTRICRQRGESPNLDWTRGEEAKNNWSVKLDQLMELGVVFPSTVETLRKWQLQSIAQVCVWCQSRATRVSEHPGPG